MRVLLVYPRFPQTFWSFDRAVALMGYRVLLPPLGLITVAALLPQSWEFRLVDRNIRAVEEATWRWADLVILSAMLVQKTDLAAQIALAKKHGCRVAVGGPFATSTPEAPELAQVDFLVLDEGEITLPLLVQALERDECRGRFTANGEKPDLEATPPPRFDLLELNAYAMMAIQFSRGCPFQCEFCDIIVLYGRRPRTKTPQQLIAELEVLRRLNWRGEIFLVDDNFIGNKRNVNRLLAELEPWQRQRGFPFAFTTEASIDLASDPDLIDRMTACGFNRVFLGIETPDSESLSNAGKHQNTRHPLLEAVATITEAGLLVMAGFILGFDGERAGAGERIVAFVEESAVPLAMVGILQALPNTALWHRLEREQRLLQLDPDLEASLQGRFDIGVQTNLLNFLPSRPMEEIAAEFLEAFDRLYDPATYLARVQRYASRLGCRQTGRRASFHGVLGQLGRPGALPGLITLLWRQGVRRPSRALFWRCLLDTLWHRPERLDQVLWMCLLNEHFLDYRALVREQVEGQLRWSRAHPQTLVAA